MPSVIAVSPLGLIEREKNFNKKNPAKPGLFLKNGSEILLRVHGLFNFFHGYWNTFSD